MFAQPTTIYTLAGALLAAFCILGAFDGFYFHLYRFQLHKVPSARTEHIIHSVRALVFAPIAVLMFVLNSGGILLYIGIAAVIVDQVLEYFDIMLERDARLPLGGVPGTETVLHVFASSAKFAAIACIIASKPIDAYALSSPLMLEPSLPIELQALGSAFAAATLIGGIYSFVLMKPTSFFATRKPHHKPITYVYGGHKVISLDQSSCRD